jgi:hypothetical protein
MPTRSDRRDVRGIRDGFRKSGRTAMASPKCPVCDWEIKDKGHEVKVGKKKVLVCCDDCAKKVQSNPDKYAKAR